MFMSVTAKIIMYLTEKWRFRSTNFILMVYAPFYLSKKWEEGLGENLIPKHFWVQVFQIEIANLFVPKELTDLCILESPDQLLKSVNA